LDPWLLQTFKNQFMKFGKLLGLFAAIMFTINAMAAVVTQDDARMVARNFVYEQMVTHGQSVELNSIVPELVQLREFNGLPVYYVYNLSTGGFVIVSADDVYTPIIGYSPTGTFDASGNNLNFNSFIQEYADQIDFARSQAVAASSETSQAWNYYETLSTPRMNLTGDRDVDPLLLIMWNQDFPYNAYCPEDAAGPGGHVYAGCVATAMSMIMTYYRYPLQGIGSYSYYCPPYGTLSANFGQTQYNWDAMLNSINAGNGEAINAIAELQYQCGVSVRMGYAPDGSGAYSQDVPAAIKTYFGYSTTAQYLMKMSYTTTTWETMLVQSIDEKKPLYYSGQSSSGGHAFVCDGYQITGTGKLFHFNFGWSGSENGFYALTDVNGFSSQQGMVRNFVPSTANYPYNCDSHVITSPLGIFEDRSGPLASYLANSACSWLIQPTDSVTAININFNQFSLGVGDSVKIYNGTNSSAPLLASFGQNSGTAQVTTTGDAMYVMFITDGSDEGDGFQAEFTSTYPVYCTNSITTLSDPEGFFSDGSGTHNYNNNTVCKWKINPGDGAKDLTLVFSSFDLEDGKDYLKVYDIPSNQLLGNLTGSTLPAPIVSQTGQMLLMFSSNGFNNYQGFEAEYYISNVKTNEKEFASGLAVYPNPAAGYTEVKFNLNEQSEVNISLFNLLGESVYTETGNYAAGFFHKTLQLGHLNSGVYMLRISSSTGSIARRLVIN